MHTKTKKTLLAGLIALMVAGAFFAVARKHHGGSDSTGVQNGSATTADRAIPVEPTSGPEAVPTDGGDQPRSEGVPVITNAQTAGSSAANGAGSGSAAGNSSSAANGAGATPADRQLAMAPGGGVATGPHGSSNSTEEGGVPVIVGPGGNTPTGGSASSAPTTTPSDQKAEIAKQPEPTCFTFTYKHKPTPGHDSEESCSHHKNLIHLAHQNVNPASLCIRVNGKPVHFTTAKGKSDDIVVGAIAGPHAVITASYCTGTMKCAQTCKVPKDEFLDAIGGAASDGEDSLAMGQWQQQEGEQDKVKNAKLVADMKKELNGIDGQEGTGDGYTLFQGWLPDAGVPSCGDGNKAETEGGTEVAGISGHHKKGD